jgi:hypothetical protein
LAARLNVEEAVPLHTLALAVIPLHHNLYTINRKAEDAERTPFQSCISVYEDNRVEMLVDETCFNRVRGKHLAAQHIAEEAPPLHTLALAVTPPLYNLYTIRPRVELRANIGSTFRQSYLIHAAF